MRRACEKGDDLNDGDGSGGYVHEEEEFSDDDDEVMSSPVCLAPSAVLVPAVPIALISSHATSKSVLQF